MVDNYPSMSVYTARISKIMGILVLMISAGGLLYFRSPEGAVFALGALLTCSHNVLKLHWIKHSVGKAASMDSAYGVNFIRGQGMLRMLFTLAVMVGAGFLMRIAFFGFPFLMGAVFGLLTMPLANYSMAFFVKKDYEKKGEDTDA
jgi:hypothetical protein